MIFKDKELLEKIEELYKKLHNLDRKITSILSYMKSERLRNVIKGEK